LNHIHSLQYDIEEEVRLELYRKIRDKYEAFEEMKNRSDLLKRKFAELISKPSIAKNFALVKRTSYCEMSLESDYNESLLETGINLRKVQVNINDASIALKIQEQQLINVYNNTENVKHTEKKASTQISNLSSSQRCQKLLLNTIAISLFILLVALIILKVLK
jgi:hypothetical protein